MNKPLKPRARQAVGTRGLRLPQVEPVRLYRQIAALISDRIDEGLFPVGSLLPAERDLAEQLGVSRTSVREALIALEVGGKVSIRVGHGVQILQATPRMDRVGASAEVSEGDIGPIQMMEARRLIEPRSAELAALNRDSSNLDRIERALAAPPPVDLKEQHPIFRLDIYGRQPSLEDIMGERFWVGPVPYGGMTHQEFLDMSTPKEFQSYAGFTGKYLVAETALTLAETWAVKAAIHKFKEAKSDHEREAARKEVVEALAELEKARKAQGLDK